MEKSRPRNLKELKEVIHDQQKKAKTKAKLLSDQIKRAANAVAATEDGRLFLWHLSRLCGWGAVKVVADAQAKTVDPISTSFNCAQENIWLRIRALIHREHLIKIEFLRVDDVDDEASQ